MINYVRNKYAFLFFLLKYFDNCHEILFNIFKKKSPPKLLLKNGFIIETDRERSIIDMIKEIWHDEVYTPTPTISIQNDDVVVDIGANVGIFSLFASTKTKNKIYCYEPFPPYF